MRALIVLIAVCGCGKLEEPVGSDGASLDAAVTSDVASDATDAARCKILGEGCASAGECCSMICKGGACGSPLCVADNQPCMTNAECCVQICDHGICSGGLKCKTSGNACQQSVECCSKQCDGGRCQ